jgi:hypothetical protein
MTRDEHPGTGLRAGDDDVASAAAPALQRQSRGRRVGYLVNQYP